MSRTGSAGIKGDRISGLFHPKQYPTAVQVVSRMSSINSIIHFCKDSQTLPAWWLNQPLLKNMRKVNMGDFFPQFFGVQIPKDIWSTTSQPMILSGWNKPLINPLPTEYPSTRSSSVGTLLFAAQDTSKSYLSFKTGSNKKHWSHNCAQKPGFLTHNLSFWNKMFACWNKIKILG